MVESNLTVKKEQDVHVRVLIVHLFGLVVVQFLVRNLVIIHIS